MLKQSPGFNNYWSLCKAKQSKLEKLKNLAIGGRWTDEYKQCFQELRRIIARTVTMAHANPEH